MTDPSPRSGARLANPGGLAPAILAVSPGAGGTVSSTHHTSHPFRESGKINIGIAALVQPVYLGGLPIAFGFQMFDVRRSI